MKQLKEIAAFLGKESDISRLDSLEKLSQNGGFYLTFCGMFSAGKSKLINNLLGIDLLPVKSSETTAVVTYLCYGEEPYSVVHFQDGSQEKHEPSFLKKIFQSNETIPVEQIESITVFLDNPVLEKGLIIVDTPGVNTTIERHLINTADALQSSNRMVYVLGGTPTAADQTFITDIASYGIEIDFVRTKVDLINALENDPAQLLCEEEELLKRIIGQKELSFCSVSNEMNSPCFSEITTLRNRLFTLSENIAEELQRSIQLQASVLVSQYQALLQERKQDLEQLAQGNAEELKEKAAQKALAIAQLEDGLAQKEERIHTELKSKAREAETSVHAICDKNVDWFKTRLENCPKENIEVTSQQTRETAIKKATDDCTFILTDLLDALAADVTVDAGMPHENALPVLSYSKMVQSNHYELDTYKQQLKSTERAILSLQAKQAGAKDTLSQALEADRAQELETALANVQQQLRALPTDIPMMISENQPIQPSKILKTIGTGVDLALLFIPGEALAAGVTGAAKALKISTDAAGAAKAVAAAANGVKKLDTAKDALQIVKYYNDAKYNSSVQDAQKKALRAHNAKQQSVNKTIDTVAEKVGNEVVLYQENRQKGSANILDMLTVAHWTETLGKQFDKPIRMEVNALEQAERAQKRESLQAQAQNISEQKLQTMKENHLLETELEELVFLQKEEERRVQWVQKKLSDAQQKIDESVRQNYIDMCASALRDTLTERLRALTTSYFKAAKQNLPMYISIQNNQQIAQLSQEKQAHEKLLALSDEVMHGQELATCKLFLSALEAGVV